MESNILSAFTVQPGDAEFTNVSLEGEKKKKQPRKVIHFSDGVLEEYSTDEEEDTPPSQPVVDPKTLTWGPWMWYRVAQAGWGTLSAADFCGEKLAWFFGITTPKYQSAIDEFYRRQRDEEEEKEQEERALSKLQGLSSVDVQIVDGNLQDKGSGHKPVEKY